MEDQQMYVAMSVTTIVAVLLIIINGYFTWKATRADVPGGAKAFQAAIKRQEVPAGASQSEWRTALTDRLRMQTRTAWLSAMVAVLGLGLVVTNIVVEDNAVKSAQWTFLTTLFFFSAVMIAEYRRDVSAMLDSLPADAA
jgi:hypothetical protein